MLRIQEEHAGGATRHPRRKGAQEPEEGVRVGEMETHGTAHRRNSRGRGPGGAEERPLMGARVVGR